MSWLTGHWMHLTFVLIYLAVLARHAWVGRQRVRGLEDYLVAGRRLGGSVVALSFYATFMSTNTFIGAAGKSWDVGLVWCLGGIVLVALCCVSWLLVAPRFMPLTKEYESLTVPDFLGHHYRSPTLCRMAAVVVCFASIAYLVAIYRGSALALENLLDMHYIGAAITICLVVTIYTLAGGFESVVMTDALQGLLMAVGAVGMAAALLWKGNGLGAMLDDIRAQDPQWTSWHGKMPLATVLALNLSVALKYVVEPRQLTRFYGLKDQAALRRGAYIAPLLVVTTYVCLLPVGGLAHALLPADAVNSSDEVVPHLLASGQLFGPVLGVLFLLVLLAAAMSSIDSVLLVAASSLDRDFFASNRNDAKALERTRLWVVIVSLISVAIAISPAANDIMTLTAFSGALYGACFLPALVVGLFWRPSAVAALASIACGATAVVFWFGARMMQWTSLHEVYVGVGVSLLVFLFIGCASKPLRQ